MVGKPFENKSSHEEFHKEIKEIYRLLRTDTGFAASVAALLVLVECIITNSNYNSISLIF